ncbi:unnamed protein product [Ixodes pacificus]
MKPFVSHETNTEHFEPLNRTTAHVDTVQPAYNEPRNTNGFQFPVTVCIPVMRYEPTFNEKLREACHGYSEKKLQKRTQIKCKKSYSRYNSRK